MRELLALIDLDHLADAFEREGIDLDVACTLTDEDLVALGVTRLGDRRKLRARLSGAGTDPGGIVPVRRPAPLAPVAPSGPRGVVVHVGEREIVWWLRDRLHLGRSPTEGADLRLAVEPFLPADEYAENHARSYRISRVHLGFERRDGGVFLTPLGGAGTTVNDARVPVSVPVSLVGGEVIGVAEALRLEVVLVDDAVHLRRLDNRPELSYVFGALQLGLYQMGDDVEVFPGQAGATAPVRLSVQDGQVQLAAPMPWQSPSGEVEADVAVPLRAGDEAHGIDGQGEAWSLRIAEVID